MKPCLLIKSLINLVDCWLIPFYPHYNYIYTSSIFPWLLSYEISQYFTMFYHILVYIYISHSIPWKSVLPHQRLHGDFLGPMWRKPVALLWHRPGNSASYRIIRWWDYIDMFYLSSNIMENYLVYIYIHT